MRPSDHHVGVPTAFVPGPWEFERHFPEICAALSIRAVEERLLSLFSQGKLFGTVHTCIGQEFTGVALARTLQPLDWVVSNHRCHGHFLSYGGSMEGLIAEVMGKQTGVCGGRGGSQHLFQGRFMSNGIQGGIAPIAAGLALSLQQAHPGAIAAVFLGDGTMGQGVLYETLNIAAKWSLPVLFIVENNQYAQSTAAHQNLSGSIRARFEAFGIEGRESSTWHWPALFHDMQENVAHIRAHGKPRYQLIDTYRLKPHSKGDDFRSREEIGSFEARDPLHLILEAYRENAALQDALAAIQARVDAAVSAAEAAPFAPLPAPEARPAPRRWLPLQFEKGRCATAIQQALDHALGTQPQCMMIGEDLEAPYGGAFKVAGDLSLRHPGRVRNTPISEAAITGIGNGMALAGMRPVVEIMFGDFATLAADQWINHAAKFRWMYNDQASCPLVLRTPMGGRRGYGPTHSQSLEKHFTGLPGTRVLALHHRCDVQALYADIFAEEPMPTLVCENKRLYTAVLDSEPPAGYSLLRSEGPFPITWLSPAAPAQLTIVALGGTSTDAEAAVLEAFDAHELVADLFMPTCLYPLEIGFLAQSLQHTRRLLVVEEGQAFASVGAELLAQAAERWPGVKARRLAAAPCPIPTARPLEEAALPNQPSILQAILDNCHA